MSTNLTLNEAFKPEQVSVEDCLIELARFGSPSVSRMKKGWYTRIDVFVTGAGVQFKVESEISNNTLSSSVIQCYDRLAKAMKQIKETT